MATINRTDRLYVTIIYGSSNLYITEMSGLTSLGEVFRQVKHYSKLESGVVTLRLRNRTQGWTQQHTIVLKTKSSTALKSEPSEVMNSSYPSLFDTSII